MPRPFLLACALLPACGPLPAEPTPGTDPGDPPGATSSSTSSAPTTGEPGTTTGAAEPTTSGTTLAQDFVHRPDGGGPGTIDCDVFAQDCPPGQKCVAWAEGGSGAWNAHKCVDVTGDGAPGDPCTTPEGGVAGIDDCAVGVMCWYVDETNHGTCVGLCTGTPNAPICPLHSYCYINSDGILNLCFANCDPLLQDCAGEDLCIADPDGTSFSCVLDASGDEGQANDPCEFANACDPGLVCLHRAAASTACDPASPGCCQPFCKFPGSPCPNPDQQCIQFFDPMTAPIGYESVGICAIPS